MSPIELMIIVIMQPIGKLNHPAHNNLEVSANDLDFQIKVKSYDDTGIPSWSTFYYRVVARGVGWNGCPHGMRSEASSSVTVITFTGAPPAPPTELIAIFVDDQLKVTFRAQVLTIPVGDFRFKVKQFIWIQLHLLISDLQTLNP